MAFKTLDGCGFLEFGVSNAKYLGFDTLDENALTRSKRCYYKVLPNHEQTLIFP